MPPDEQVAVVEQLADLPLDRLLAPGRMLVRPWWPRPAPRQLRRRGGQPLALLGHGREDRLGHFAKDMEGTELMRDLAEDRGDRLGIQRRAVGRDPRDGQPAGREGGLEPAEEGRDVRVVGVVIEDLVGEPLEGAVVNDRQDAERPVIQLVDGDEAREVGEGPVEMLGVDPSRRLFPPGLDPVLDRGVGDEHAMVAPEGPFGGAIGEAVLDDQPDGERQRPGGCNGCRGRPGRRSRR